ncbi:hypothetical protein GEV33_002915 [Tenebrio molitor]|uniref:Uncharacterized protein n=1 Tax=Tenebrio molitor TaxID=7067 RepID=A0A8J6LP01_TENMO|nr:hypothetical protein GEV33_002915 [Tenebrio molitor]
MRPIFLRGRSPIFHLSKAPKSTALFRRLPLPRELSRRARFDSCGGLRFYNALKRRGRQKSDSQLAKPTVCAIGEKCFLRDRIGVGAVDGSTVDGRSAVDLNVRMRSGGDPHLLNPICLNHTQHPQRNLRGSRILSSAISPSVAITKEVDISHAAQNHHAGGTAASWCRRHFSSHFRKLIKSHSIRQHIWCLSPPDLIIYVDAFTCHGGQVGSSRCACGRHNGQSLTISDNGGDGGGGGENLPVIPRVHRFRLFTWCAVPSSSRNYRRRTQSPGRKSTPTAKRSKSWVVRWGSLGRIKSHQQKRSNLLPGKHRLRQRELAFRPSAAPVVEAQVRSPGGVGGGRDLWYPLLILKSALNIKKLL